MRLVEQAIFASSEQNGEMGHQVVARSSGVCTADAHELPVWEPSRDSMLETDTDAESYNFHPLPSGNYCISRSTPEPCKGGESKAYTHCLIVPPEVLARFGNNPFAVIDQMTEQSLWRTPRNSFGRLEPFMPSGGAAPVDQALLRHLAIDPGVQSMAMLVQQACNAVCLAVAGVQQPKHLIAGLFSCLPPECRLDFSFSTGLKFSPRRPFRIVAVSDDPAERLWVSNYANVTLVELGDDVSLRSVPLDGWASLIERVLSTDHIPFFAAQISKRHFDLVLDDLPALGLQLLETLDGSTFTEEHPRPTPPSKIVSSSEQHAHSPHRQFEKTLAMAATTLGVASEHQGLYPPEILEKLEYLDDLVYEAISGQTDSLEKLRAAWPKIFTELGEEMLAESREQYLRYALSIWDECANVGDVRDPARAIQALDVLCLLFGTLP
jgi:hypothetical protein